MRFIALMVAGIATMTLAAVSIDRHEARAADKPQRMLRHIVMYEFKKDLAPAQLQEVIDAFVGLKKIETVVSIEHGPNVSPEGKSDGLTYCFVVTFRNEADRQTYIQHPLHKAYVALSGPRKEKVVVVDYWTDGSAK